MDIPVVLSGSSPYSMQLDCALPGSVRLGKEKGGTAARRAASNRSHPASEAKRLAVFLGKHRTRRLEPPPIEFVRPLEMADAEQ